MPGGSRHQASLQRQGRYLLLLLEERLLELLPERLPPLAALARLLLLPELLLRPLEALPLPLLLLRDEPDLEDEELRDAIACSLGRWKRPRLLWLRPGSSIQAVTARDLSVSPVAARRNRPAPGDSPVDDGADPPASIARLASSAGAIKCGTVSTAPLFVVGEFPCGV